VKLGSIGPDGEGTLLQACASANGDISEGKERDFAGHTGSPPRTKRRNEGGDNPS